MDLLFFFFLFFFSYTKKKLQSVYFLTVGQEIGNRTFFLGLMSNFKLQIYTAAGL